MYKTLLVIGAFLAVIGLAAGGFLIGQASAQSSQPGWMMGNGNDGYFPGMVGSGQNGAGMMNGYGMMGNGNDGYSPGMMGNGTGTMNGYGMMGMMMNGSMMAGGMMNGGMMGSFSGLNSAEPFSVEETETAILNYLAVLGNDNLNLGEIMIFDNHAYAQIVDSAAGRGAFEVLVDPVSGNVFPEPGPNMMWNTEYGMMNGRSYGMMGGNMMGNMNFAPDREIGVTAVEAIALAQEYLDAYLPGKMASESADTFPGYYTVHILENGETVGMLSVNAYSGQVFVHHWHGEFIEMVGES